MPQLTDEQSLAINSIGEHVLVSAGAGSGKTFVLVERYIQVLAEDGDATIDDIIAVTYTRKAAEEMRSRLKARLKELGTIGDTTQQERWLKCLAEVETARIGTIHSLCESVIKNFPAEAGIDPNFEILNDLERAELLAESIDQALHFIIEKPMSIFGDLLEYPIEGLRVWLGDFLRSPLKYKESRKRFRNCTPESIRQFAQDLVDADIERTMADILADQQFVYELNYLGDTAWKDPDSPLGLLQSEMLSYLKQIFAQSELSAKERFNAACALAAMKTAGNLGGVGAKDLRTCMRNLRSLA